MFRFFFTFRLAWASLATNFNKLLSTQNVSV